MPFLRRKKQTEQAGGWARLLEFEFFGEKKDPMDEIQVLTLDLPKTRVNELALGWNIAMNRAPKVEIRSFSVQMRTPQALTVRISPPNISVSSFYFGDPEELCKPNEKREKKNGGRGDGENADGAGNAADGMGTNGGFSEEDSILPWDENAPGSAEDDTLETPGCRCEKALQEPSEEELLPDLCLPSGELPVSFPTPDSLWDLPLGAHSPLSRDGS